MGEYRVCINGFIDIHLLPQFNRNVQMTSCTVKINKYIVNIGKIITRVYRSNDRFRLAKIHIENIPMKHFRSFIVLYRADKFRCSARSIFQRRVNISVSVQGVAKSSDFTRHECPRDHGMTRNPNNSFLRDSIAKPYERIPKSIKGEIKNRGTFLRGNISFRKSRGESHVTTAQFKISRSEVPRVDE